MTREYIPLLSHMNGVYRTAPPATDRKFWDTLISPVSSLIIKRAEKVVSQAIPALPASLYLSFSRTGNRTTFEECYFTRRRMLGTLTLAYCLKPKEVILDKIIDLVWAIVEETSWCLPAHNSYIRDTEQLPLPINNHPIIDLFSAETASTLAQVYSLLKPDLDATTPIISERIERELERRILTPYLTTHFWWMGNGDEPMNNWTAWCTQNVLLTAFLTPVDKEDQQHIAEKALCSLDCFLKDYGEDGCCSEGAQYYRHAALCLYLSLDILNRVTDFQFEGLLRELKIQNMASFIRHIHAQGPYYFNFSDCSALAGPCSVREYLFAQAVDDPFLASFAKHSAHLRKKQERDLPQEINLTYRLLELLGITEEEPLPSLKEEDHYYPSVGIWISRDKHLALAVKAGGNDDSHNHNDTGSITLYKDGFPILIDIGVEDYTKQTFSQDRYSIWTMRSTYHNVTNFPPYEQQAGKAYRCTVEEVATGRIVMELAHCYPEAAGLGSYRRTVTHEKNGGITILEQVKGKTAPVLTLMCAMQPAIEGKIIHFDDTATMQCNADNLEITCESITVEDKRLRTVWPKVIYRLLLGYTKELSLHIE